MPGGQCSASEDTLSLSPAAAAAATAAAAHMAELAQRACSLRRPDQLRLAARTSTGHHLPRGVCHSDKASSSSCGRIRRRQQNCNSCELERKATFERANRMCNGFLTSRSRPFQAHTLPVAAVPTNPPGFGGWG